MNTAAMLLPIGATPSTLVGVSAVVSMLGLEPAPDGAELAALLAPLGARVLAVDEAGAPLWARHHVVACRAKAQEAWERARAEAALSPLLDRMRVVLEEVAEGVLRRAVERNIAPMLDELDERIVALTSGMQALNRQSAGHGDALRDIAGRMAGVAEDAKSGPAGVRRDVSAVLARVESECSGALKGLGEELRALRLSVNELAVSRGRR